MPIDPQISTAARNYRVNDDLLKRTVAGLTPEEWLRRPSDASNHLLWVVGHVLWARGRALSFLGIEWSKPWLALFARGAKLTDSAEYPKPEEIILAAQEVGAQFNAALEAASEETLSGPSPVAIPGTDGKISGLIDFLSYHETYHLGQAAYLRSWLGHGGVSG